jgi:uncharacterized membrane protein YvbJ
MRYNKHKFTMENQDQQNIQPDYDFILNQPGSSPTPQTPAPVAGRSRKKLIIVTVCAIVLVVGVAVAALLASKDSSTSSTTSTSQQPPANPVDQLLTAIKDKDYKKAATFLPKTNDNPDVVAANLQNSYAQIDLDSCQVSPLEGNLASSVSVLSCLSSDHKLGYKMTMQVSQDGGTASIVNISTEIVKP